MGGRSGDTELAGIHTYREAREAREESRLPRTPSEGHLPRSPLPPAFPATHASEDMRWEEAVSRRKAAPWAFPGHLAKQLSGVSGPTGHWAQAPIPRFSSRFGSSICDAQRRGGSVNRSDLLSNRLRSLSL